MQEALYVSPDMTSVDHWPPRVSAQLASQTPDHSALAQSAARLPMAQEKVLRPC